MKERSVKIECVNVSKTFHVPGQKQLLHVLNKVSLKVYENEFLVILGPGQSGKTVLLNCMDGLIEPTDRIAEWSSNAMRFFPGKQWNTMWPSAWLCAACP